jgi:hypothetical protein
LPLRLTLQTWPARAHRLLSAGIFAGVELMPEQTLSADEIAALRVQVEACFLAGVRAADPAEAVARHLHREGDELLIRDAAAGEHRGRWPRIHLIAFGKAAIAMAEEALALIPRDLLAGPALVVTNPENARELSGAEVFAAAHPVPSAPAARRRANWCWCWSAAVARRCCRCPPPG